MPIAVVIPLYNHAATLGKVVAEVQHFSDFIIVVDDGSSDHAVEEFKKLDHSVHIIRHPRNQGKGAAILSGAEKARELKASHIVTIDADGQHYGEDLPEFFAAISKDPEAITVGCRKFDETYVPGGSRFGRLHRHTRLGAVGTHRDTDSVGPTPPLGPPVRRASPGDLRAAPWIPR